MFYLWSKKKEKNIISPTAFFNIPNSQSAFYLLFQVDAHLFHISLRKIFNKLLLKWFNKLLSVYIKAHCNSWGLHLLWKKLYAPLYSEHFLKQTCRQKYWQRGTRQTGTPHASETHCQMWWCSLDIRNDLSHFTDTIIFLKRTEWERTTLKPYFSEMVSVCG